MSSPSKNLEKTLAAIFHNARTKRHEYVTIEHLLLGLLNDPDARNLLEECDADMESLAKNLSAYIDRHIDLHPPDENGNFKVLPTLGVQRVLSRTSWHSANNHEEEFGGADVIAALFAEEDCHAVTLLKRSGVERLDALNYLSHGDAGRSQTHGSGEGRKSRSSAAESVIAQLTVNLNEEARAGRIDNLVGRNKELARMMQILMRRRKNNPLLVGPAGVGKTALVEGLAVRIEQGQVPELLKDCKIYTLDLGSALAGTRYRGDFEQRIKLLLKEMVATPGALLFIDEIHTIIGAGASSGSTLDAANMFKPLLSSGKLNCIGATTHEEFQAVFERDRALARRFQQINIAEPSTAASYKILRGLRKYYEKHHGISYTDGALRSAVDLSSRHITGRYLPDKAIDVIDEAAARLRLGNSKRRRVGVGEIENVVADIARIPPRTVSVTDRERLRGLQERLRQTIFGQDKALETLTAAVRMARAGLRDEQRPIGSFLFTGPTGVGKTEVCRQLAKALDLKLLQFDMSEYQERHTVSRLIGAPPGYVGFDQGGQLTDAVLKEPHSIVLLDEIEKSHPEIYNILLQIMDHGTLTDSNGRKVDFRNVILVMTSNAGALENSRRSIGFTQADNSTDSLPALEKIFTPEFRNRIDSIVCFQPLSQQVVASVADKFIAELQARLEVKGIKLRLGKDVKEWLVSNGYNPQMGARPMKRLIQDRIITVLADLLLFESPTPGTVVKVSMGKAKGTEQPLEVEVLPQPLSKLSSTVAKQPVK